MASIELGDRWQTTDAGIVRVIGILIEPCRATLLCEHEDSRSEFQCLPGELASSGKKIDGLPCR